MKIDVIILAAGKGSRMYSNKPKVLHELGGKPMVQHVIDAALPLGDIALHLVVGHGADQVKAGVKVDADVEINFVEQSEQLGTGHAVLQSLPSLRENSLCLILYGDVPLIKMETLTRLIEVTTKQTMGLLTIKLDDPTGYGRIVRNSSGQVTSIVEQKDGDKDQLAIKEVNTGIMCVPQNQLANWLPALSNDNAQQEYYLTDIIAMAAKDEVVVHTVLPERASEVEGVNNKMQLSTLERAYQQQRASALLLKGVTLADPARIDIRGGLTAGEDVFIDVNAVFSGDVQLGNNVSIGPNCTISNASIGDNTHIYANSVIEDASVGENCAVGPFGRLRPGAQLERGAKIGNFVEVKNSRLGEGSKANHLAYVGDADVGSGSNIGAGTITCNYDGANKFKTTLGKNVFIGSNSTLVAPLVVEDNGFVGAGSTINQTVPEDNLAVSRSRQKNIEGWKRPKKKLPTH